jgi:hypothetical protein
MRKSEARSLGVQERSPSEIQTIRQIASQARAYYLKERGRAGKQSPTPLFGDIDKNRAYEYAKRAAQRLGIEDEDLILSAASLVHLDPKEWDARFPRPSRQRNVSNFPSPFEQQLEKTRREASLTQGPLVPPKPRPFQGTALENAPGVRDLTDVPEYNDLVTASVYWGLRRWITQTYGSQHWSVGWGEKARQMGDDEIIPYVQNIALSVSGRELSPRELRAALGLWRAMATYDRRDWDTLLGRDWKKRVGDVVRKGKEETNEQRRQE